MASPLWANVKLPKPMAERLASFVIFGAAANATGMQDKNIGSAATGTAAPVQKGIDDLDHCTRPISPLVQTLEQQRAISCAGSNANMKEFWTNFYFAENNERPIDSDAFAKGPAFSAFGTRQHALPPEHRSTIVRWMAEACQATHWGLTTFYTAVHAFDSYVLKAPHLIHVNDLGPLSAACLYFGAQLRESTADCNILTLDRFRRLCPEIGSPRTVRHTQAHLIDTLQGSSIGNRTPYDICLVWLASFGDHKHLYPLYLVMLRAGIMKMVFESLIQLSNLCFLNGINTLVPSTTWIAAGLVVTVQSILDAVRRVYRASAYGTDPYQTGRYGLERLLTTSNTITATIVAQEVCHYPGGLQTLTPFCRWIGPILSDVFNRIENYLPEPEPTRCYLIQLPDEMAASDYADPKSVKSEECRRRVIRALDEAQVAGTYFARLSSAKSEQFSPPVSKGEIGRQTESIPPVDVVRRSALSHRTVPRANGLSIERKAATSCRPSLPREFNSVGDRVRRLSFHDGLHTVDNIYGRPTLLRPRTAPIVPGNASRDKENQQPLPSSDQQQPKEPAETRQLSTIRPRRGRLELREP